MAVWGCEWGWIGACTPLASLLIGAGNSMPFSLLAHPLPSSTPTGQTRPSARTILGNQCMPFDPSDIGIALAYQ